MLLRCEFQSCGFCSLIGDIPKVFTVWYNKRGKDFWFREKINAHYVGILNKNKNGQNARFKWVKKTPIALRKSFPRIGMCRRNAKWTSIVHVLRADSIFRLFFINRLFSFTILNYFSSTVITTFTFFLVLDLVFRQFH